MAAIFFDECQSFTDAAGLTMQETRLISPCMVNEIY